MRFATTANLKASSALAVFLLMPISVSAYRFSGLEMLDFANNPDRFSLEYSYWILALDYARISEVACYPDGIRINELEQITIEWMEAHPERLNQDGEIVIYRSHWDY